jgi:hypothetical protein
MPSTSQASSQAAPQATAPDQHDTEGDYMAEEKARYAAGAAPQNPPLYPVSAADTRAHAWHSAVLASRVAPTLPKIQPNPFVRQAAQRQGEAVGDAAAVDPITALKNYPQGVNAEYLAPMTQVINDAAAAGDMGPIEDYAMRINPEIGVGLYERAVAAQGEVTPVLTSITATTASDDQAPADGTTANVVRFQALDQRGQNMAATLAVTSDSTTATLDPTDGTTATDAPLTVNVTDTVAETVTVTATSGGKTGTVSTTFAEVAPEVAQDGQGDQGQSS